MNYEANWIRLIVLFGVPLAVVVAVSRHLRGRRPFDTVQGGPSAPRTARRGMIGMTLLGLCAGGLGAAGEDYLGETALVRVLYVLYMVGLAPMRPFAWISGALGLAAYPIWDLATLIAGLLAVPVTWYVIFLGLGHLIDAQRRSARSG
jgi:hypothetical protein